ncbi:hypothetical protein [Tardiphaga sp. 839_C3_N1_4]|uniref:hypothetical protein n=1 Tax=Tardiphaga sp. 839_C3_N1_4 TaxID=3240761 RepID=UPI003F2663A1
MNYLPNDPDKQGAERRTSLLTITRVAFSNALSLISGSVKRMKIHTSKFLGVFRVILNRSLYKARFRFINLRIRASNWSSIFVRFPLQVVATLVAMLLAASLLGFDVPKEPKVSEIHLAAAQIIGAALALVLSLSIIPAQRAAELFSMSILKLYARDRVLISVFIILVSATLASVALGAGWLPIEPKYSICIQLLLMGFSFDALRWFYSRTLDLLIPQTAINIVLRECDKQLSLTKWVVDKASSALLLATPDVTQPKIRAQFFRDSQLPTVILRWCSQFEEFAHRFVSRRDTSSCLSVLTAMQYVALQYADARKGSVVLHLDQRNIFAGHLSDIQDVFDPIYLSVLAIANDASAASNERIVIGCVEASSAMAKKAMTMLADDELAAQKVAPLAFAGCFHLGRCIEVALKANMLDAVLIGVRSLQSLLLSQSAEVDTRGMEQQAFEVLSKIAVGGYSQATHIITYPAVEALFRAVELNVRCQEYEGGGLLEEALAAALAFVPFEVSADSTRRRSLQIFPVHNLGFEASLPLLLEIVAGKVEESEKSSWRNPYDEFLHASEDARHYFRTLSQMYVSDGLFCKWAVDALLASARVHLGLLRRPLESGEGHKHSVVDAMKWLLSWASNFYSVQASGTNFVRDGANGLSLIAIDALELGYPDVTVACAEAIARIAEHRVSDAYIFADQQTLLELLARAAEAISNKSLAIQLREMIIRPKEVSDGDWNHYLDARNNRISHLDRELSEWSANRRAHRNSPVERLSVLMSRARSALDVGESK